ncbi:hypothetical protein PCA20602_03821 [Pandoraea capi]|uniref:Ankyrin n=1 Tax=Pandoraea capi TaxID=2508286 RepID=A0ABY6WE00_9BURK|nr:hypothetical protein PCA20602_03821 [Pandoraea capi]
MRAGELPASAMVCGASRTPPSDAVSAPALVLDVLLRHGADPNEPLSCEHVSGPACGLDHVAGGTAMHHAALAGRGDAMKVFFIAHGGRLDAITRDGYDPIALAGASTHRTFAPRYGLIENTLSALYAWIATDGDNTSRRAASTCAKCWPHACSKRGGRSMRLRCITGRGP